MIGIIGINGKIGDFIASTLCDNETIIGFDKNSNDKYKVFTNKNDFFDNNIDIVIDFSNSELSKEILLECISNNIKVISGTSNIPNLNIISNYAYEKKVSFVYLENFSKGINQLVKFMKNIECDKKEIIEEHYYLKSDVSQTALALSKLLNIKNISSVRTLKKESNHYIKFYLENEEIEIIHRCFNPHAYKEILLEELKKIKSSDFYFKCGIIEDTK